jgi:flavin-dependent dehydrogenase
MQPIRLVGRDATQVWAGDVAVVGATLAGVAAALAAAQAGRRVCLLEAGPTLATDLSAGWLQLLPSSPLVDRIRAYTSAQGAPPERPLDILLGTLAADRIVADAGVMALVKVRTARLLRDRRGRLAGVEVVGKSGRQSVKAPVVIDATPGQGLARAAVGLPERRRLRLERRGYLAGVELPAYGAAWDVPASLEVEGNRVEAVPAAWPGEALLRVRLIADGRSETALLSASLHAVTGVVAWLRQQVPTLAALALVDVAPGLCEEFVAEGDEVVAAVQGTGLYLLEAGTDLAAAEAVGRDAVAATRALPRLAAAACDQIRSRELAAAPEQDLPKVRLPPALAQMHEPRDVVVAGYGTGGAFAAIAAAEAGVSVAVLDAAPVAGGIGSAGRIHSYYHGLRGGTQDRFDESITGSGGALAPKARGYHPVGRAEVLTQALLRPGLEVFSGHTVFGVVREGSRVTGVLSAAADGYHVFPCQVVIDATGDGDVAAAAGAPMTLGRAGDGFPQPFSYTPSLMQKGELHHHNFDAGWVDPTDTLDFSRAHFEGRAQIACRGPYTPERHYCSLASILGLRESRFAKGPLTLTFDDFLDGHTFPDTVCSGHAHHDNHAMDYAEESEWSRRHVVMFGLWRFLCHGDVPYRALLTRGVDGVLLGCRALSVDHDLHQLLRMQRDMQVIGEVCGVAAAEAVKRGVTPRALPLDVLKARLTARGIQPRPPQKIADLPVEGLLAKLSTPGDECGLAMWRLSRLGASVDWDGFFARETAAGARFCAAIAAAMGKAAGPAALDVLWETVRNRVTEPGLGIKSPPRCFVAALALAELQAPGAADAIGALLTPKAPPPDLLLLLRALARTADPKAVGIIQNFLQESENELFPIPLWGADPAHPTSFRAAIVIRAVRSLAELGAAPEPERLEALRDHPLLLMRRHARRVLAELARVSPDGRS